MSVVYRGLTSTACGNFRRFNFELKYAFLDNVSMLRKEKLTFESRMFQLSFGNLTIFLSCFYCSKMPCKANNQTARSNS